MNLALDRLSPMASLRRRNRRRRTLTEAGSVMLGIVLLIWSLLPIYNMLLIALDPEEGEIEFAGNLWPPEPSFEGFIDVVTQEARYLEEFWHQFGNSLYIGLLTMVLTVLIGSLASFAVSRAASVAFSFSISKNGAARSRKGSGRKPSRSKTTRWVGRMSRPSLSMFTKVIITAASG